MPFRFLLLALVATMAGSALAVRAAFGQFFIPELGWAWLLTLAHGALALAINHAALRSRGRRFFVWGLGVNTIRAISLLTVVILLHRLGMENFQPFLVAVLIGYFCFQLGEVLALHAGSVEDTPAHE